jgi:hypothetical protein
VIDASRTSAVPARLSGSPARWSSCKPAPTRTYGRRPSTLLTRSCRGGRTLPPSCGLQPRLTRTAACGAWPADTSADGGGPPSAASKCQYRPDRERIGGGVRRLARLVLSPGRRVMRHGRVRIAGIVRREHAVGAVAGMRGSTIMDNR